MGVGNSNTSNGYKPPALQSRLYNEKYIESLPDMKGKVVVVTGKRDNIYLFVTHITHTIIFA